MIIRTENPDPAWTPAILNRRAVLWIGRDWQAVDPTHDIEYWSRVFRAPWAAIYLDALQFPIDEVRDASRTPQTRSRLRLVSGDPDSLNLAADTVPVYALSGYDSTTSRTTTAPTNTPHDQLVRLKMLAAAPHDTTAFLVHVASDAALTRLQEAVQLSSAFSRLVVLDPNEPVLRDLVGTDATLIHWQSDEGALGALVEQTASAPPLHHDFVARILGSTGFVATDVSTAINPAFPILDRFDFISDLALRTEYPPTPALLESYMAAPSASWAPYGAGIPFPRHTVYRQSLLKALGKCRTQGASGSVTAWLPAEDGSGASTTLRQLCFDMAREGFPSLVAKPDTIDFDFKQLASFLTRASQQAALADPAAQDTPWLVAFDAQHTQSAWTFVAGLCNGLKRLMRPIIVLAVRPPSVDSDPQKNRALGRNVTLGPHLRNRLNADEATALGRHLNQFLPASQHRSDADWQLFIADSTRIDPTLGSRSLFWLALRFWLFRFAPVESSFRNWLYRTTRDVVDGNPETASALLRIAGVAKYRLMMPSVLLPAHSRTHILTLARDGTNPLGLHYSRYGQCDMVGFAHPLIAEELLRLAADDPSLLSAIGKSTCLGLLDLELHLFDQLFQVDAIGNLECIPLAEELVTVALRIDERDAPRNYHQRQRIVGLLERAPDSLWDASQVFNHHLAKGRRHLAMKPPEGDPTWVEPRIREQLQLAENHIMDALTRVAPVDTDRSESPLNLYVSLALTHDARARRERQWGHKETADDFDLKSEQAFRKAQSIDSDNTYVLENYARFLLFRAMPLDQSEQRVRMLVDAVTLLEQERDVDEGSRRNEPILDLLGKALEALEAGNGIRFLERLMEKGSESAAIALVHLRCAGEPLSSFDDSELEVLERILDNVPVNERTWRSLSLRYRIVSLRRRFDFAVRGELLEELAATEMPWPLQLRVEHAILFHQLGMHTDGQSAFSTIRDELTTRGSPIHIPPELRYLADPASDFQLPLQTTLIVKDTTLPGRNLWGIPDGWASCRVPFRPYMFDRDSYPEGTEVPCLIRFTNFGPQAVPPHDAESS